MVNNKKSKPRHKLLSALDNEIQLLIRQKQELEDGLNCLREEMKNSNDKGYALFIASIDGLLEKKL